MDELIVKSTRWTSLLSSPQNGQFITKSTKSGRIYLQVHQIDKLISMSTRWTNLSLEVHKVDVPIIKKWTSLKNRKGTGRPLNRWVHRVDEFKPIEHRLSQVRNKERRQTCNNRSEERRVGKECW